jgi:hypothetical protein
LISKEVIKESTNTKYSLDSTFKTNTPALAYDIQQNSSFQRKFPSLPYSNSPSSTNTITNDIKDTSSDTLKITSRQRSLLNLDSFDNQPKEPIRDFDPPLYKNPFIHTIPSKSAPGQGFQQSIQEEIIPSRFCYHKVHQPILTSPAPKEEFHKQIIKNEILPKKLFKYSSE